MDLVKNEAKIKDMETGIETEINLDNLSDSLMELKLNSAYAENE